MISSDTALSILTRSQASQSSIFTLSAHSHLDETIWIRLRSIDLGVLSSILQSLMPAQVNLEVMLVRQRVVNIRNKWLSSQDLLAHLVHGVLDTGGFFDSEQPEGDLAGLGMGCIELVDVILYVLQLGEDIPLPAGVDASAEDAIPRLREGGVFVSDERMEHASCGLEDKEFRDATSDLDAFASDCVGVDQTFLGAVSEEGVRMWLAVNFHACPSVLDYGDVGGVDV